MVGLNPLRPALALAFVLALLGTTARLAVAGPPPVLLTFDVEDDADIDALEKLHVRHRATWFVTGRFTENHPELVKQFATQGTVGSHSYSHPHLAGLEDDEVRKDLLLSKILLTETLGRPPVWYRAPFLEHDEDTRRVAWDLGFRGDSSDPDRWAHPGRLASIPISTGPDEVLASDYDLLETHHRTDDEIARWLREAYDARKATGRPFVILLHPRIAVRCATALSGFLRYVEEQGGAFLSYDDYLARCHEPQPKRFGVWVDFSLGGHDPARIALDAKRAGLTDVFVMAKSPEGVFYYPSRHGEGEEVDLFGATVDRLRAEGIRVHAWIPVNLDQRMARRHPEWAMQAQSGAVSTDWLSPGHPEARAYLLDTVREVLERYEVAGIHLDYVRYPSLDYDFAPHAVSAFAAQHPHLEGATETARLISEHYVPWTNWRMQQIAELVGAVRETAHLAGGADVQISAALLAQAATSYRVMEVSGQDYAALAHHLDLVLPMAYVKDEQRPAEWISNVVLAARLRIGDRPLLVGVSAYRKPGAWDQTVDEFSQTLDFARLGSDGIVAYPYLYLYGHGDEGWNMPAGAAERFRAVVSGEPGGVQRMPFAAHLAAVAPAPRQPGATVPILLGMGLALGLLVLALLWREVRRRRRPPPSSSEDATRASWHALEQAVEGDSVSGTTAAGVVALLRGLGSERIDRFRTAYVLEGLEPAVTSDDSIVKDGEPVSGWNVLGQRYLDDAGTQGFAVGSRGSRALTAAGRREIERARQDGYGRRLWAFVERCLHQVVAAQCPHCGERSRTHWYWPAFECGRCRRDVPLHTCPEIHPQHSVVSVRSFHTR